MDGLSLPSMALDTRFPAGMTSYWTFVYNDERAAWERSSRRASVNFSQNQSVCIFKTPSSPA